MTRIKIGLASIGIAAFLFVAAGVNFAVAANPTVYGDNGCLTLVADAGTLIPTGSMPSSTQLWLQNNDSNPVCFGSNTSAKAVCGYLGGSGSQIPANSAAINIPMSVGGAIPVYVFEQAGSADAGSLCWWRTR